eukprot:s3080_g5.t1
MPKPRKGGWHYGGHGGKKGGDKKGPQKGAGKRSIPIPFLPPFPPANIVPPRPKMRPNSSGDGARDDRIPRSPSHPPPRRNDKKEPAESRHEEGGDPSAPDEAMNRADGTGGTTEAPTMPVETPKAPSPPEAPKASSPSGAPKASSPSEAHATLRAALLSFSAGTPESQATSMFLRYMEDNGLMPPCPEGQVHGEAFSPLPAESCSSTCALQTSAARSCCDCCCAQKTCAARRKRHRGWSNSKEIHILDRGFLRKAARNKCVLKTTKKVRKEGGKAEKLRENAEKLREYAEARSHEDAGAASAKPVPTPVRSEQAAPAAPAAPAQRDLAPKVEPVLEDLSPAEASNMSIEICDSESEDPEEEDEETKQLMHAPTLRLDDCADPGGQDDKGDEGRDGKADNEAEMWKRRYQEMAIALAQLQMQQHQPSSPSLGTPTPKKLFSPEPSPGNGGALPAKAAPVALPASPPLTAPETKKVAALPPVPKQPEVPSLNLAKAGLPAPSKAAPAKACPSKAAASSEGCDGGVPEDANTLRDGEETLAEEMDLSHEEGNFQYDQDTKEYFVQTADTDMPSKPLEHLSLTDACGVEAGEKGKVGAVQANGKQEARDNLKTFTDATHQKASQVVTWLGTIDEKTNERILAEINVAKAAARDPCVKVMAAEHIYRMLLAESKKRKTREDGGDDGAPPKAHPKRRGKAKAAEK